MDADLLQERRLAAWTLPVWIGLNGVALYEVKLNSAKKYISTVNEQTTISEDDKECKFFLKIF